MRLKSFGPLCYPLLLHPQLSSAREKPDISNVGRGSSPLRNYQNSTQSLEKAPSQATHNRTYCEPRALSPRLWDRLGMNSYLETYPNGDRIDVQTYAARVGALDFQCGVGKVCNPGQLCEAVYGKDWYALVAAQNWNDFVNVLYRAAGDAFEVVSDVLPTMLIDFERDHTRAPRHFTAYSSLLSAWISSFPASLFRSIGPIEGSLWMSWGALGWFLIVMISFQATAIGWLDTWILSGNGEPRFSRSSDVTLMLGHAQEAVQGSICNVTQRVLSSGISTKQGLYGLNIEGLFTSNKPLIQREVVQKDYENSLKVKTLVKIWRLQNAFIIRGAEPCIQDGENGAYSDPERLSYCGSDSIMMNIVRGEPKGDGFIPTIYRASLVESKYGLTTEYLTTQAWNCQQTYGVFEYDPYSSCKETLQLKPEVMKYCVSNLPVCDATKPVIMRALKKGMSITKACRDLGGLPI